jgi:hypothetical protein
LKCTAGYPDGMDFFRMEENAINVPQVLLDW